MSPFLQLATVLAVTAFMFVAPASGHMTGSVEQPPHEYGDIVLSVDKHFALTDRDGSGLLTSAEYIDNAAAMKAQDRQGALLDFKAMDLDGDGRLTLSEFRGVEGSVLTL